VSDDHKTVETSSAPVGAPPAEAHPPAPALTELMASGAKVPARPGPDLEAEALRAAELALAEGEKALAAARAQLAGQPQAPAVRQRSRRRELALRALLAVNVLAMVVVAMLPTPGQGKPAPVENHPPAPQTEHGRPTTDRRFHEPWVKAQDAADRGAFAEAITILEAYLADSPRMAPSQQLNVLMALAYYAFRANDFQKSDEFRRRADALEKSHALPDDLVAEAKAAQQSGDQERLRRIWARFLLQQRQIPSSLYKHVAEAYLQLGDSYRQQANAAAEQVRLEELRRTAERLQQEALQAEEKGK
jgi:tetratricopeptide (TPR) repeat protein